MPSRTRIAAVAAALAATAAIPAVANAATVPMRGVVSGSPYGASAGQMAIPVLFSKMTVSNTGLKSPVGVIIVKRTQKVKLPNGAGSTIPVNLRTGDRFKGSGVVGSLQQKTFYPRVVFPQAVVYFRSKELSLSELSLAVASLKQSLADLTAQLTAFKTGTIKAFNDVYAQLADLKKQLAALAALQVPDFQAQIDALTKKLNDLIAGLPDFSKFALLTQLPDLTGYAKLADLTDFLTLADLAPYAKLTDLAGFLKAADVTTMINSAITALNLGQYAPQSALDTANQTIATLTSKLNAVCTSVKAATVTLDPDGAGVLLPVTVPVALPGIAAAGACGP
jgi:hypothetical protein